MAGRHTKKTPETVKRICDILRAGNTRKTAYTCAGISDQTFANWLLDLEFFDAVKKAEAEAVVRNVTIIQEAASKSWQAAAWWLERKHSEDWKERKDVKESLDVTVSRLTPEERQARIEAIQAAIAERSAG